MKGAFAGIVIFTLALVLILVYIGEVLTKISGQSAGPAGTAAGVSPEAGETIFWGKGKCHTCHSVGGRGSAIRAPNLGETGPLRMPIGARAEARAQERAKQGKSMTATDYLVESIAEPGAYVVEGYKNEMPLAFRPPVALKPDEIKAVITYLQSLGGTVEPAAVKLPPAILAAARAAPAAKWELYMAGDAKAGEELFFNRESPAACAKCHKVGEKGSEVGPELTGLAGTRDPQFIIKAILEPSAEIASGFESILIVTKDGRYITGLIKKEDAQAIEILDEEGKTQKVPVAIIDQKAPQKTSLMPGNFGEVLTMTDFHNLVAYLLTLK